ncbi:uncharacterized protein LOC142597906 [Dermatophagoides farinae]|uniref:uncharacterized protein LOC142597906 n=1 Tax=Dermatophagoides farinae TaxID=6954 RepID=UPI003F646194
MQLMRECNNVKVLIPYMPRKNFNNTDQYEGATVLEPLKGLYSEPICVLDFASLYPSIMIAYNICYSTLVKDRAELVQMNANDYNLAPNNEYYVKPHVKLGVLPAILKKLLDERKKVKSQMKNVTDNFKKMILNGIQLALKLSANSVYGYTGSANTGHLPCLALSESVTSYGRQMIQHTKTFVEENEKIQQELNKKPVVVYGDTDSVMINFGFATIQETIDYGNEISLMVSKEFPKPIFLEFEKVFKPFLLLNKKRYAVVTSKIYT